MARPASFQVSCHLFFIDETQSATRVVFLSVAFRLSDCIRCLIRCKGCRECSCALRFTSYESSPVDWEDVCVSQLGYRVRGRKLHVLYIRTQCMSSIHYPHPNPTPPSPLSQPQLRSLPPLRCPRWTGSAIVKYKPDPHHPPRAGFSGRTYP